MSKTLAVLPFLLAAASAAFSQAQQALPADVGPVTKTLVAEAKASAKQRPDETASYQTTLEELVRRHQAVWSRWGRASSPPPLDLTPGEFPLPWLARLLVSESAAAAARKVPPDTLRRQRPPDVVSACLKVIAKCEDDRKVDVLWEYLKVPERPRRTARLARQLFAAQVSLNRAAPILEAEISADRAVSRYGLAFLLIDRFAAELPEGLQEAAYGYLRRQLPGGAGSHRDEPFWRALLKLDAPRARRELAEFVGRPEYMLRTVWLLLEFAAPSPAVAAAMKPLLESPAPESMIARSVTFRAQAHTLLMMSAPEAELPGYIRRLDQLIAKLKPEMTLEELTALRPVRDELGYMIVGLHGAADHEPARDRLRRMVGDRRLRTGLRAQIVITLGRAKDPALGGLLKTWFAEEPHN